MDCNRCCPQNDRKTHNERIMTNMTVNNLTSFTHDLIVIGAGPVGASLALASGQAGLRVAVIDALPVTHPDSVSTPLRHFALAYGSRRILEGLSLWSLCAPYASPIHKIHISEQGSGHIARFDRQQEQVSALGYVIAAPQLQRILIQALTALPSVTLYCPVQVASVTTAADNVTLKLQFVSPQNESTRVPPRPSGSRVLTAPLLVAADGAHSLIRRQLGITAYVRDYAQVAITGVVKTTLPHQQIAYERFTSQGPLALLPLADQQCAVVCIAPREQRMTLQGLNDTQWATYLHHRFGDRLGALQPLGPRSAYPVMLVKAHEAHRFRTVLIGNAAHTLHPIAAQGFNLGLRDVAALADVLVAAHRRGQDIGHPQVLNRYARWRQRDQQGAVLFTDGLIRLFSPSLGWIRHARCLGLLAFDLCPPVKHQIAHHTLGVAGRLPRLSRGLGL